MYTYTYKKGCLATVHKRSRPPSRHLADTRDTNIIIFNCPYRTILQFSKTKYIIFMKTAKI